MHAFSTQKLSISTTQLVIHGDLNPEAQTSYDIIFRQMQKSKKSAVIEFIKSKFDMEKMLKF